MIICLVLIASSLGCGDSETPISPADNTPEIVMTVVIDTCNAPVPASTGSLDSLCGKSSLVSISPAFVYSDVKSEYIIRPTKIRTIMTGPADWHFSDPHFRAALLHHFDGRSLRIRAMSTPVESRIGIFAVSGRADPYSMIMISLGGPFDAAFDSDGYPIIDTIELLAGGSIFLLRQGSDGWESAEGPATGGIALSKVPIEADREPPIVARPDLTPEELRAAPTVLRLGHKTLVFAETVVAKMWGSATIAVSVRILEESLDNVDEARMDFVWVVHESGVWEPDVGSIWNTHEFLTSGSPGPVWSVGTDVDVVVGFVDIDAVVHLMRTTTRVQRND